MYLLKCSALLQFNGSATAIASQEEPNSAEALMSPKGMKTKPVVLLLSKTNTQSFFRDVIWTVKKRSAVAIEMKPQTVYTYLLDVLHIFTSGYLDAKNDIH